MPVTATYEPHVRASKAVSAMNLHVTQPEPTAEPHPAALKFTYASGSRPLDGYTIKRGVGRGGFGEVYYATSDAGKEVALKLIRRNLDVELRGVTQCLNMKHPNLLGLFDIRQDELGDSWVVMEYIHGETLDTVLARNPNGMPRDQALAWFSGIAAGVAYLHDHGIVHRDLKPGNIFGDEGLVKIGDYGLSKFISASRRSGQTESVGTVHYMAPEIANGRYGKEIDIYALGIMLYEMLTGHVPFDGESVGEVLMKHLTAEPNLSELEEPFRTVVARCLNKDPDQRLQTVQEIVAMLPAPPVAGEHPGAYQSPGIRTSPNVPPVPSEQSTPYTGNSTRNEEPVWKWVRENWECAHDAWKRANLNDTTRIVLIILAVYVAVQFSPVWIPLAFTLAIAYGAYYVIRELVLAFNASPAAPRPAYTRPQTPPRRPAAAPPAPPVPPAAAMRATDVLPVVRHVRPAEKPVEALLVKTPREHMTELLGSMLLAAFVSAAVSVLLLVMEKFFGNDTTQFGPLFAWLSLTGTIGAWCVMIPSKFWEGTKGDTTLRRFVMLAAGLVIGLAAWALDEALLLELRYSQQTTNIATGLDLHDATGQPMTLGYLAYFGVLFLMLRWWKQADPLRRHRLSLWGATFVTAVAAWLVGMALSFPMPWGVMAVTAISVAVQLSSPWLQRRRFYHGDT